MSKIINIGILAHVDAGKTTVTEHFLYKSGAINKIGRVDKGTTQTDSMDLERKRGITIRSTTTSFIWDGIKINLIDTPGHVDFVAEVERSVRVLDGIVLVVSAKEGIQAQTRVLWDVIRKLNIPVIIFMNKLDRLGSNSEYVIKEMKRVFSNKFLPLQNVLFEGSKRVNVKKIDKFLRDEFVSIIGNIDEGVLKNYLDNDISENVIREKIEYYSKLGKIFPVMFGSALHGIGIDELLDAIIKYFPAFDTYNSDKVSALVYKIDRSKKDEKRVYVRVFDGAIRNRDKIEFLNKDKIAQVKKIRIVKEGKFIDSHIIKCNDIGILYGIKNAKIGDIIGYKNEKIKDVEIIKPTLKATIKALNVDDNIKLSDALSSLSEQDPLLNVEISDLRDKITVSLIGEIQREILKSVLLEQYGIDTIFSDTTTIYKETPMIKGALTTKMFQRGNLYRATVGLEVVPIERGKGIIYESHIMKGSLLNSFRRAVEETVFKTLKKGLLGWEVTDVLIKFTESRYDSVTSTAGDFRGLTEEVLTSIIKEIKTELLEPIYKFHVKVPERVGGKIISDLVKMKASFNEPILLNNELSIEGLIPLNTSKRYGLKIATYTEGKGMFISSFYGYKRVVV